LGHKKGNYIPRESDISPYTPRRPNGSIVLNFGLRGNIDGIIIHVKFYVNRFRGFVAVTPQSLGFSIGMTGGSYNSVSTDVLHCDVEALVALLMHAFTMRYCILFRNARATSEGSQFRRVQKALKIK